jgi:hypothetical protein
MSKALLKRTSQDKNDNNEYEKIFQDNGVGTQQPKALTETRYAEANYPAARSTQWAMTNRNVREDGINSNNSYIRNEYKRLYKDQTVCLPRRNQQPLADGQIQTKNSTQLHDVFSFKAGFHFSGNQNFTLNARSVIMLTLFKAQNYSHFYHLPAYQTSLTSYNLQILQHNPFHIFGTNGL